MDRRILGLDIIRSVAILLVVWIHSTYVFETDTKNLLHSFTPAINGVSIFFVLSGYLIGGILLKLSETTDFTKRDLLQFWIRRWFRTLPNYFLVLVFLLAYDIFVYKGNTDFSYKYLLFIQNLFTKSPDFFPESWSLSIEEWFYLLFPLLCYIGFKLIKDRKRVILLLAILFLIVPFVLRVLVYHSAAIPVWDMNFIVVYRLDSLMYGVIGAYIHRYRSEVWSGLKGYGLLVAIFLFVFLSLQKHLFPANENYWPVYYYNVEALATLCVLPYFSSLYTLRNKGITAFFTFISTISYAMYVLNLSTIQWRVVPVILSLTGLKYSDHKNIISFGLYWILLFVGSYLLHRFYEVPLMNLRDKVVVNKKV